MKKALVFVEAKDNQLKKSSLELLSLFQGSDYEVHACAIGSGVSSLNDELAKWNVQHFHAADSDNLKDYNPEVYRQALVEVFEKCQPQLVVASSNMLGRDVFPRIAAKFDCAYMSDVTEISVSPELTVHRPLYSGKCSAQVCFTDESCRVLLIRPNQISVVQPSGGGSCQLESFTPTGTSGKTSLEKVERGESEKLDLTEADVIVSGGRGLKEADNFKLLHDLAEPLAGTVGASRAVVDLGWVPHSMQVGQTGKTVAPTLYIAAGISGAIQHLAGMNGSKVIVAINKDEKAPIFQKATYGLVGDLFDIVPLLTEKLKAVKS